MTHARRPPPASLLLAVAGGGAVGASVRHLVAALLPVIPWATLLVNVGGSFALGVVVALFAGERRPHPLARPLVTTGFFGAFTTYSTFAVETLILAVDANAAVAVVYVTGSVAGGLAALWAGLLLGRRVTRESRP